MNKFHYKSSQFARKIVCIFHPAFDENCYSLPKSHVTFTLVYKKRNNFNQKEK